MGNSNTRPNGPVIDFTRGELRAEIIARTELYYNRAMVELVNEAEELEQEMKAEELVQEMKALGQELCPPPEADNEEPEVPEADNEEPEVPEESEETPIELEAKQGRRLASPVPADPTITFSLTEPPANVTEEGNGGMKLRSGRRCTQFEATPKRTPKKK